MSNRLNTTFELVLNLALLEAERRDIAKSVALAKEKHYTVSNELDSRINRLFRRERHREKARRAGHFFKRAAACVVLLMALSSAMFMPVRAVQEAVAQTVVEWGELFSGFFFSGSGGSASVSLANVNIGYWPPGYDGEAQHFIGEDFLHVIKVNRNDGFFKVKLEVFVHKNYVNYFVDSEHTRYTDIVINGQDLHWIESEDHTTTLVGKDTTGTVLVHIQTNESLGEAIRVFQGVKINQ